MKNFIDKNKSELVLDTETTGLDTHNDKILGYAMRSKDGELSYGNSCPDPTGKFIIGHNFKFDAEIIYSNTGKLIPVNFDTMIAYYLLHIDRPKKLEKIVKDVFDIDKKDLVEVYNLATGKKRKNIPDNWYEDVPIELLAEYAQEDVSFTYKIYEYCREKFKEFPELEKWFYAIEMPLCNILIESEIKGVRVDTAKLKQMEVKLADIHKKLDERLRLLAGNKDINFNSPKQLQELLYVKFKLPKLKKTKTGYSTDTKTLEKLAERDGFCKNLVKYKALQKLISSFVKPLQKQADKNGRIHAWFSQTGTKTRRKSCKNPNLQQIPSKTDLGQDIRKCFIPADEHKFLIADYSQIELRLLAHFSQEPKLVKAFRNNEDVHTQTAEFIGKKLGVEFPRAHGKLLNFSIIYGKTDYGFSRDWNCTRNEAQKILEAYFALYPRVKEWIEEQQDACKMSNGWIKTIAGLPLYVKDINSNDKWLHEEGKRQAVNYLIQGSSQDIIKTAIVEVNKKLSLVPALMVHDELVYELHESVIGDVEKMGGIVKGYDDIIPRIMESSFKINVPLEVDSKVSDWWEK